MNKIFLVTLLIFSAHTASAETENRVARLYAEDGPAEGAPLFTQKIHRETDAKGLRVSDSTIADDSGAIVMTEHALLEGTRIVAQDIEQRQVGEAYTLEVKDGKATFKTFALKEGKRTLKSEKASMVTSDFVTGPSVEPYLKQKLSGKTDAAAVPADFGVFEIERSVPFEFIRKGMIEGGKALKVRLQPASVWVSMIVAPIDLEVDAKTFVLRRYKGRTPLKRKINGNWKSFDSLIVYSDK
jgi:hypothetical protein